MLKGIPRPKIVMEQDEEVDENEERDSDDEGSHESESGAE